jgi:hypothetical protein
LKPVKFFNDLEAVEKNLRLGAQASCLQEAAKAAQDFFVLLCLPAKSGPQIPRNFTNSFRVA